MSSCEDALELNQALGQSAPTPGAMLAHLEAARVRQGTASTTLHRPASPQGLGISSTASTMVDAPGLREEPGGEPWPFRIATMQAQNKMYMAVPNLTDIAFASLQHLGSQLNKIRLEILDVGETSDKYDELMTQMIKNKIKFDKVRMGIYEGNKLPDPFISDIKKICSAGVDCCADAGPIKRSDWLNDHDMADWARVSVMTPTKHLVSRLPESRIGGMAPLRLRPTHGGKGTTSYSPWIFQFFSVSAEVLFIIMTWVFGSVPVLIKSLENPNKKLEIVFYSVFFIFWSALTSMLTPKFETRLYLNVGMAALYVQNIRAD